MFCEAIFLYFLGSMQYDLWIYVSVKQSNGWKNIFNKVVKSNKSDWNDKIVKRNERSIEQQINIVNNRPYPGEIHICICDSMRSATYVCDFVRFFGQIANPSMFMSDFMSCHILRFCFDQIFSTTRLVFVEYIPTSLSSSSSWILGFFACAHF